MRTAIKWNAMLCAALALCLAACLAVSVASREAHSHDDYTPLTAQTAQITASGDWYLEENLTISGRLEVRGEGVQVTLCLNGHQLSAVGESINEVILVSGGAELTICDCYDAATHTGEAYQHSYRHPVDYLARSISGGLIYAAGRRAVTVEEGALTLASGAIAGGGSAQITGGGIRLKSGTVHLCAGALVKDNYAANGGGIYVESGSAANRNQVQISGGEITDNEAAASGGGAYLKGYCDLRMTGGSILGNSQASAGGKGGGVYVPANSTLSISGGQIFANTAAGESGGVYLHYNAAAFLSGSAVIEGNTAQGQPVDLCAYYMARQEKLSAVTVCGALDGDASIGLRVVGNLPELQIAVVGADSAYNEGVLTSADAEKFFSNDADVSLLLGTDGKLSLGKGRLHPLCGAVCLHEQPHENVLFQALPEDFTGGNLPAGSYFLTGDLALSAPITVEGEGTEVHFCLNGNRLQNSAGRVFIVSSGAALSLCDCYAAGTHPDAGGHRYKNPFAAAWHTAPGGLISGNPTSQTAASGGVSVTDAAFQLYGGTIGAASIGGVSLTNSAFEMYGGAVNCCYSSASGAGIYADERSKVAIYGGEIQGNLSPQLGAGVYTGAGLDLQGCVEITGNSTPAGGKSNLYLANDSLLHLSGSIAGSSVGVSRNATGPFTTGGGGDYLHCFTSDVPVGLFLSDEGGEAALTEYDFRIQPVSTAPTVTMNCPEHVSTYRWYRVMGDVVAPRELLSATTFDSVTGTCSAAFAGEADNLDLFTIALREGDTLRVTPLESSGISFLCLVRDGEELRKGKLPDDSGHYYATAPADGVYTLRVGFPAPQDDGGGFRAALSLFHRDIEVTNQTAATYTGGTGLCVCRVAFNDDYTVIYSNILYAPPHSHFTCGGDCAHEEPHEVAEFIPLANAANGGLMVGDELFADGILQAGSYVLAADVTLDKSLVMESGTVNFCLNGCTLACTNGSAVRVKEGAKLRLCSCVPGGTISGRNAEQGGGVYIAGDAEFYRITVADASAAQAGGGVYLAGGLSMEGGSVVDCRAPIGGGIYQEAGAALELTETVAVTGSKTPGGIPSNLYLPDTKTLDVPKLTEESRLGVHMETPGIFTSGAAGAYAESFSSDMQGYFVRPTEEGEYTLDAYAITRQPSGLRNSLELNNPQGASYQWYAADDRPAEGTAAEGAVWLEERGFWQPAKTGECFTLTLAEGEILRVEPRSGLPEDTTASLSGLTATLYDGAFVWIAPADGDYKFRLNYPDAEPPESAPSLSARVYSLGRIMSGYTGASISGPAGAYLCLVRYPDGTMLRSHPAIVTYVPKPAPAPRPWQGFSDVPEDAWYYSSVRYVCERLLMNGTSDDTFSPEATLTRGQLAAILWRSAGSPEEGPCAFTDVRESGYYAPAIAWAAEIGVVLGYGDGRFGPEDPVTREQIATILYRYAVHSRLLTDSRADLSAYTDAKEIHDYAGEPMAWCVAVGLLKGVDGNTLKPCGCADRAQTAVFLERFMKL